MQPKIVEGPPRQVVRNEYSIEATGHALCKGPVCLIVLQDHAGYLFIVPHVHGHRGTLIPLVQHIDNLAISKRGSLEGADVRVQVHQIAARPYGGAQQPQLVLYLDAHFRKHAGENQQLLPVLPSDGDLNDGILLLGNCNAILLLLLVDVAGKRDVPMLIDLLMPLDGENVQQLEWIDVNQIVSHTRSSSFASIDRIACRAASFHSFISLCLQLKVP